jgi:hypothetical protein
MLAVFLYRTQDGDHSDYVAIRMKLAYVMFLHIVTYPGFAWLKRRVWIWWSNLLDLYTTWSNSSQITNCQLSSSDWILHCSCSDLQLVRKRERESYITTDGQSASLSWYREPIWGLRPDFYYCQTISGLLIRGTLSDDRTGLSFTMYNVQYVYILHVILRYSFTNLMYVTFCWQKCSFTGPLPRNECPILLVTNLLERVYRAVN